VSTILSELGTDGAYVQSHSGYSSNGGMTVDLIVKIKESGTYVVAVGHRIEDAFNRYAFETKTFTGEAGDQVPVSVWVEGYTRSSYWCALFQSADLIPKRATFWSFLRDFFSPW